MMQSTILTAALQHRGSSSAICPSPYRSASTVRRAQDFFPRSTHIREFHTPPCYAVVSWTGQCGGVLSIQSISHRGCCRTTNRCTVQSVGGVVINSVPKSVARNERNDDDILWNCATSCELWWGREYWTRCSRDDNPWLWTTQCRRVWLRSVEKY